MWQLISGVFLGWSLGANDAADAFGTAVASRMIRFRTAIILCSVFIVIGAVFEGQKCIETYHELVPMSLNLAFLVALSAAFTVTLMNVWGLPVSTSQAVVGGLVLVGILQQNLDTSSLLKVIVCWVTTPVSAVIIAIIAYFSFGKLLNLMYLNIFQYDRVLYQALIIASSYASYALGAKSVANITGPFVGSNGLTPFLATIVGAAAIDLGVLTYSRNVMMTLGKNLVRMNAFSTFVVIFAEAVTIHIYTIIGVPVSTTHAIVGAVLGIGILKGVSTINKTTLWRILFGWIMTPFISASIVFVLYWALKFLHII